MGQGDHRDARERQHQEPASDDWHLLLSCIAQLRSGEKWIIPIPGPAGFSPLMHLPGPVEPLLHQWWFTKKRLLLAAPPWTYTHTHTYIHTHTQKRTISYTDNWKCHDGFGEPIWTSALRAVCKLCKCEYVCVCVCVCKVWNIFTSNTFPGSVLVWPFQCLFFSYFSSFTSTHIPHCCCGFRLFNVFFLPSRQPLIFIYLTVWWKTIYTHLKSAQSSWSMTVNIMSAFPVVRVMLLLPG